MYAAWACASFTAMFAWSSVAWSCAICASDLSSSLSCCSVASAARHARLRLLHLVVRRASRSSLKSTWPFFTASPVFTPTATIRAGACAWRRDVHVRRLDRARAAEARRPRSTGRAWSSRRRTRRPRRRARATIGSILFISVLALLVSRRRTVASGAHADGRITTSAGTPRGSVSGTLTVTRTHAREMHDPGRVARRRELLVGGDRGDASPQRRRGPSPATPRRPSPRRRPASCSGVRYVSTSVSPAGRIDDDGRADHRDLARVHRARHDARDGRAQRRPARAPPSRDRRRPAWAPEATLHEIARLGQLVDPGRELRQRGAHLPAVPR